MRPFLTAFMLLLATASVAAADMRVEGTAIVVTDESGQERRGAELDGAELDLGDIGTLRIVSASLDEKARFPDEVWLLQGELRAPGMSTFEQICTPDASGDTHMLIYSGYFDDEFRYVAANERFSVTCTSGVEGKCLRWGYLQYKVDGARFMAVACTQLLLLAGIVTCLYNSQAINSYLVSKYLNSSLSETA